MVVPIFRQDRGHVNLGWLEAYYAFSFANHYDPARRGFRALRVLNEGWLAPRSGFGDHPHTNREILTYVLEGRLEQREHTGDRSCITAGELQRLTTGGGMSHDEFNPSGREWTHYLEFWIVPERQGLLPSRERRLLPGGQAGLRVVGARDARDGTLRIHQDVVLVSGILTAGERAAYRIACGRHAWLQLIQGAITVNGVALQAGDGATFSHEAQLAIAAARPAEFLILDLA
jgi:redox-sensitive bicupin YhaK (pirin superfamily)